MATTESKEEILRKVDEILNRPPDQPVKLTTEERLWMAIRRAERRRESDEKRYWEVCDELSEAQRQLHNEKKRAFNLEYELKQARRDLSNALKLVEVIKERFPDP